MPINLTEQQKQIGKDNFHEAVGVTRRDFLLGAAAGVAAGSVGLGATYFGYKKLNGKPIKVGWIGTGLEGSVLLNEHPPEYMDVVAIADLRPSNRELAFKGQGNDVRMGLLEKLGREKCRSIKVYKDHHELLQNPEIEAVVIAVPLNAHAPVAIDALKAGKHVLCEKLMAYNITQCKEMIAAAKEGDGKTGPRLLAVGHQRHYSVLYDNANHLVKQGLLGDIKHIRASWHRNNSYYGRDSWRKSVASVDATEINQERAQKFGYSDVNQLVNWRLFNATGGGLMAELGSHQLDAASIFLGKVKPLAVQGYGGKNFYGIPGLGPRDKWDDDREVDDHVYTIFEFPGKHFDRELWEKDPSAANDIVVVSYSSLNTNAQEPYGEVVFGSRGTLMMLEEKTPVLFKEPSPTTGSGGFEQRLSVIDSQKGGPVLSASESLAPSTQAAVSANVVGEKISRGYTEEMEHFAYCIRNEIDAPPAEGGLRCNGTVAMADAIMALTSNLAMKHRKRIVFKEDWFKPESSAVPETDEQVL